MPLSLEQYAAYLDTRGLTWPAAPEADPPKARPHLAPLPGIRAVLWNVYGTLIRTSSGELRFETDDAFITEVALEKTIHEFKMWNSMSRKPGQPSAYMREVYQKVLNEIRLAPSPGEKSPEILAERVWESIIKKLFQKEYTFDAGFFGSLNEFSKKVAYFFHESLQGTACYNGAAEALRAVVGAGLAQGLLADGQCFTPVQLRRGMRTQDEKLELDEFIPPSRRWLSADYRAKKPSETLFRAAVKALGEAGIEPHQVLHVGSSLMRDLAPARRFGMRTALFAGDRSSLVAPPDRLKDIHCRPDVLLTELPQIVHVIG
jgi:FMN phosphatase YigB (HAD superfamily)